MKEIDVSKKIERLIESGNKAFDLLLEEVKKPIDPDLQDDKARNAMDAQDILMAIHKMQNQINDGDIIENEPELEDKSFKAGFSEKYAKK